MAEQLPSAGGTDASRVREVLARELETISAYEGLARAAEAPEIRAFFLHLAKEEKEHVAEATFLLRKLDPDQDAIFERDFTPAHFSGEAKPIEAAEPQTLERVAAHPPHVLHALAAPPNPSASLTVGSLRRR